VAEAARVISLHPAAIAKSDPMRLIFAFAALCYAPGLLGHAFAQDVPGIENCMAEKQIERRTGCLQSNINFLKVQITTEVGKARAEAQAKLDDAVKQIDALKLQVVGLQAQLKQVQADLADVKAKASPKPPSK
jgi:septal ring factor EnvC (AmiA/AmiB activator)